MYCILCNQVGIYRKLLFAYQRRCSRCYYYRFGRRYGEYLWSGNAIVQNARYVRENEMKGRKESAIRATQIPRARASDRGRGGDSVLSLSRLSASICVYLRLSPTSFEKGVSVKTKVKIATVFRGVTAVASIFSCVYRWPSQCCRKWCRLHT